MSHVVQSCEFIFFNLCDHKPVMAVYLVAAFVGHLNCWSLGEPLLFLVSLVCDALSHVLRRLQKKDQAREGSLTRWGECLEPKKKKRMKGRNISRRMQPMVERCISSPFSPPPLQCTRTALVSCTGVTDTVSCSEPTIPPNMARLIACTCLSVFQQHVLLHFYVFLVFDFALFWHSLWF